MSESLVYVDAKNRVVWALNQITLFVKASVEYNSYRTNVGKWAKIGQMLSELYEIRYWVESDIQLMETAVGKNTAPENAIDNTCSTSFLGSFDFMF